MSFKKILMSFAHDPFKTIRSRAEKRKGGPRQLGKLLPPEPDASALAGISDDRVLAEMTKRVFPPASRGA